MRFGKGVIPFFLLLSISLIGFGEGSLAYTFGKNKVRHKTFNWQIFETPNFDIYYDEGIMVLAERVARIAEDAYDELSKRLLCKLRKTPIVLFRSRHEFEQTNIILGPIGEEIGGFSEVFKFRIVIPFDGSYKRLREVVWHELTHIFQYKILFDGLLKSVVSKRFTRPPPMWLMEGMAEFFSHEMDAFGEGVLCDAVLNGSLIPLSSLSNFHTLPPRLRYLAYVEAHSLINYIVDRFGEDSLGLMLRNFKYSLDEEKMLRETLHIDKDELERGWMEWLRRSYYPVFDIFDNEKVLSRPLPGHSQYPRYDSAWSVSGELLAVFSHSKGYANIGIFDVKTGREVRCITTGMRVKEFEGLNMRGGGLTWSQDGRRIAFVGKKGGRDLLFIFDFVQDVLEERYDFSMFDMISSPCFSPDGSKVVLSCSRDGVGNLYLLDLKSSKISPLTSTNYFDSSPCFSPDGRHIAFVREEEGAKNIYLLSLNGSGEKVLIKNGFNNLSPCFSPDGKELYFSSDISGFLNIFAFDLKNGTLYKITDSYGIIHRPAVSRQGVLSFTAYWKGKYDVYLLDLKNVKRSVVLLPSREREEGEGRGVKGEVRDYKTRLSLDMLSGEVFYSSVFGLTSLTSLSASDILGDHRILFLADYLSISPEEVNLNFYLLYRYLRRRPSFGVGIFNWKERFSFVGDERSVKYYEHVCGCVLYASYPFDKFQRVNLRLDPFYYYKRAEDQNTEKEKALGILSLYFTRDTTLWGPFGSPYTGMRGVVGWEGAIWSFRSGGRFVNLILDLRRYCRLSEGSVFAARALFLHSLGQDPESFQLVHPLKARGRFGYKDIEGNGLGLLTCEVRFPLIKSIAFSFPVPFSITRVRGIAFVDLGMVWNKGEKVRLWNIDERGRVLLDRLLCSIGVGIRISVGFFPIRLDYAWITDLQTVKSRELLFGLGYDF